MAREGRRSTDPATLVVQALVAVGSVAAAMIARLVLEPVLSPDALLVFVFSVIVAARFGGLVSGLLATAISMLVANYFFLSPTHRFDVPGVREAVRLAFFLVEGLTITLLFHHVRRSEAAERLARNQLRHFLAVVSHELRNPLSAMTSSAHLLARKHEGERAAAVLTRQVDQLNRMIGDISDLSRLERATLDIRPASTGVNAMLENAADIARPEFHQRDQLFESTLLAEDVTIRADAVRVQQVIANLLINASRYSPVGGAVRLCARVRGHDLVVTVDDNGRGLAPDEISRIFQPFVRGTSDLPGTGLGLAICKALVERHGGTIDAESDGPGCGATFTVVLPMNSGRLISATAQRMTGPRHEPAS